jgi:hypothetical protein
MNGKLRREHRTQDIGLAAVIKPTILWIGRKGQYKSAERIVKATLFKNVLTTINSLT